MKQKILSTLKNLLVKILKKLQEIEDRRNAEQYYKPIIFMNTPIQDKNRDVIGINTALMSIEYAIKNGAKIIGVLAEYGTGKTSLTEVLSQKNNNYKVIRINLWDTLSKEPKKESTINALTKSFIYQLAMGKSRFRADYVNKMLNDNYGILAFSTGFIKTWLCILGAGIFETVYLICNNISYSTLHTVFNVQEYAWLSVIHDASPIFQLIAIGLLGYTLLDANIVFSHWQNDKKRITDIGDVFAAYAYIHRCLRTWKKQYIILIEDLDRITEHHLVIDFLKELYRFNNLCDSNYRNDPVFLISIAPKLNLDHVDEIYNKIFDHTVTLNPVHYDDYKIILEEILNSEPEKKRQLNKILREEEKFKEKKVSDAFLWIYRGRNLTLRQIKERLNCTIELYIELLNKQYEIDAAISFKMCAAVIFLKTTYEAEYYRLITEDETLKNIVQSSLELRKKGQNKNIEEYEQEILKLFPSESRFTRYLAELIQQKLLDSDYRMYFYTFPKGSYIKDVDEKDICNCIEFPLDYDYEYKKVSEKIARLKENDRLAKIEELITRIGHTDTEKRYSQIVFEDFELFKISYEANKSKCAKSLEWCLFWGDEEDIEESKRVLMQIKSYIQNPALGLAKKSPKHFWEIFANEVLEIDCEFASNEEIISIRKSLIDVFGEQIVFFEKLYTNTSEVPPISREELNMLRNINIKWRPPKTNK